MRHRFAWPALALFSLLTASAAAAQSYLWDQSDLGTATGNVGNYAQADDFTVVAATRATHVVVWIGDSGTINDNGVLDAFDGVFGWAIYTNEENGAGLADDGPGSVLATGRSTELVAVDQGTQVDDRDVLRVGFDLLPAVSLEPGTYWLALREGPWGDAADADLVTWLSASPAQGRPSRNSPEVAAPATWSSNGGIDWAFLVLGAPAAWSQAPRNQEPGGYSIGDHQTAVDFTVAASTGVSAADVWITDQSGAFDTFSGSMAWRIYNNDTAKPSTVVAEGVDTAPAVEDAGFVDFLGGDVAQVRIRFGRRIALAPGTYWFALHEGTWAAHVELSLLLWVQAAIDSLPGVVQDGVLANETWPDSHVGDVGFFLFEEPIYAAGFEHGSLCPWTTVSGATCD